MKKAKFRINKVLASILIVAVILPTLAVSAGNYISNRQKTETVASSDENKAAEDISNMTGVPADEILKLREEGKTWNEILELLKTNDAGNSNGNKERSNLLTESGIGKDYVEQLKKEGFSEDEIIEARSLVERVMFQLQEITEGPINQAKVPEIGFGFEEGNKDEDLSAYSELKSKIDLDTAIYLLLKLKDEYGSIEAVMEEYLYSLQIGVDLKLAVADKKAYEEEREKKADTVDLSKIITLSKIEEQLLKKLQSQNTGKTDDLKIDTDSGIVIPGLESEDIKPPLPDVGIDDIRPKDPLEDVMKEINEIRDRSLNIESSLEGREVR